jgi:gliding motility-associated-like protein
MKKPSGFNTGRAVFFPFLTTFVCFCLSVADVKAQCIASGVDPSCNGSKDGSITSFYNDGSSVMKKYEIYLEGIYQDSATATNPHTFAGLKSGNWEVKMYKLVSGSWTPACNKSLQLENPPLLSGTVKTTDAGCSGTTGGSANLTVSGGTPPYQYYWSTGDTTEDVSNLPPGTHLVIIYDKRGCTTNNSVTIGQMTPISSSATVKNIDCKGSSSGSADITVSGGTGPFGYKWSNGALTEDLSGVPAGTYSVTITDTKGCTRVDSVVITEPASGIIATGIQQNVPCYGNSDGMVDVTASGGNGPYTYLWSNGMPIEDAVGLAAGTYTLTVTDTKGCQVTQSFSVSQPAKLITATKAYMGCSGDREGTATVEVGGGVGPYQYRWSNGDMTPEIQNLTAGTYSVTITDGNGCVANDTATVDNATDQCINIPTAFTPNADGDNDTWILKNIEIFPNATVEIFSADGNLIFSSKGYAIPWDGTDKKGKMAERGTYYYVIGLGDGKDPSTGPVTILK